MGSLLFYGAVLLLVYLAYRVIEPFLVPLAWAGILAVTVYPLHRRAKRRWGDGRAAFLVTAGVAMLIILPGAFLAAALVSEASQAVTAIQQGLQDVERQEQIARAMTWARQHLPLPPPEEVRSRMVALAGRATGLISGQAGTLLRGTSVFFFKLFLALFALYFFLRDGPRFGPAIRRLLPFEDSRREALIAQTLDLIHAGTTTTLAIAAAQGIAGGIVYAILGLDAPIFWGVVMGFCSLVPAVGSALVWGPAALWLLTTGHWIRALILVALGVGLIGMVDNLLRPLLMSGRSAMNGLVIFISLLGGLAAFGVIGLVLGPVIAAAAFSLLKALPAPTGRTDAGDDRAV